MRSRTSAMTAGQQRRTDPAATGPSDRTGRAEDDERSAERDRLSVGTRRRGAAVLVVARRQEPSDEGLARGRWPLPGRLACGLRCLEMRRDGDPLSVGCRCPGRLSLGLLRVDRRADEGPARGRVAAAGSRPGRGCAPSKTLRRGAGWACVAGHLPLWFASGPDVVVLSGSADKIRRKPILKG